MKKAIAVIAAASALFYTACGGGGGGNEPQETQQQCEERCVNQSCAGTSGNARLLCGISCANACKR